MTLVGNGVIPGTPATKGGRVLYRRILVLLTTFAAIAGIGSSAAALPSPALQAQVIPIQRPTAIVSYPTADYGQKAARSGTTAWRVVQGTGNCCGNYPTTTPARRPLDFGGSVI